MNLYRRISFAFNRNNDLYHCVQTYSHIVGAKSGFCLINTKLISTKKNSKILKAKEQGLNCHNLLELKTLNFNEKHEWHCIADQKTPAFRIAGLHKSVCFAKLAEIT